MKRKLFNELLNWDLRVRLFILEFCRDSIRIGIKFGFSKDDAEFLSFQTATASLKLLRYG